MDKKLIKIGGISGIILGTVQLAGIIMHGSIPAPPAEGMAFVHNHPVWPLTHIILIASYLVVISFYIGLKSSFKYSFPIIEITKEFVLIGSVLGAVHFLIHISVFPFVANSMVESNDPVFIEKTKILFFVFLKYAHILNRISVVLLMVAALSFSLAMIKEIQFKKWLGILGLVSSSITLVTILIVELFLSTATGDIVFALALIPTIVWVIATGISLLRIKFPAPILRAG